MNKTIQLNTAITKASDMEDGMLKIEGLASVSSIDRDGDVILPSAWELQEFLKNPILLEQHKHDSPIGKITEISVVDTGLHIVAEISKTAEKTATLVKEGILKSFSVGFRMLDGMWDEGDDFFTITKASLLEVSIVSIPANSDAIFSVAKAFESNEAYSAFKQEALDVSKQLNKNTEEHMTDKVEVVSTGAERLVKEMSDRLVAMEAREQKAMDDAASVALADREKAFADAEASKSTMAKELADLTAELAEKAAEVTALNDSKMQFVDKDAASSVSAKAADEAIFLAKALGRSVSDTVMGKSLLEKAAAGPHLTPNAMASGWEESYNTRVFNDIKNMLVIEPLFSAIQMATPTMYMPINPEAGVAAWINPTAYGSTDGSSTGTAAIHGLKEQTLQSFKLASKEYISIEEEEDSIIALMPIIRDAVVRRMANASDIALLRGQATGVTDPIAGLTKIAATDSSLLAVADQPSIAAVDKVTVDMLGKIRQELGVWGLNPADVVYIVSTEAYYDLLQDPDFRTMDLVGANATIITGQIGSIMGSPVIVSTSFEAKAAAKTFAIALNKRNFMVGNHRGLTSESDYVVEDQRRVLVSTRRMGFLQTIAGSAIASGEYKA